MKVTHAFLLSLHVLAGILFVGPVAVSTSLIPRYAPLVGAPPGTERDIGTARVLHRITRGYGALAIMVPAIGLALAVVLGRTTEVWIIAAMVLTAIAGGLLGLQILPRQRQALDSPDSEAQLRALGMLTGGFNLLWAIIVVLMIAHLGSRYA